MRQKCGLRWYIHPLSVNAAIQAERGEVSLPCHRQKGMFTRLSYPRQSLTENVFPLTGPAHQMFAEVEKLKVGDR